jgi:hypothetical protein
MAFKRAVLNEVLGWCGVSGALFIPVVQFLTDLSNLQGVHPQ